MLEMPSKTLLYARWMRWFPLVVFDMLAVVLTASISFAFSRQAVLDRTALLLIIVAPLIVTTIFVRAGIYRSVLQYLTDRDTRKLFSGLSAAAALWTLFGSSLGVFGWSLAELSTPITFWLFSCSIIIGSRFFVRPMLMTSQPDELTGWPLVVYGAGEAGIRLAPALSRESRRNVVAFIDDDPRLQGGVVADRPVYSPDQLPHLITQFGVREVIVSIPSIDAEKRMQLLRSLSDQPLKIRSLPHLTDLLSDDFLLSQIRDVDLDELLGRPRVEPDIDLMHSLVRDRVVLVTGAGGSIGAELSSLILKYQPRRLVLFEQNEYALYSVNRRTAVGGHAPIVSILGSVLSKDCLEAAIRSNDVQVVFHAAAHKHVPILEDNVTEGVRNNVIGSWNAMETAFNCGVERFVLISTDKAVRPANVMGATKRWAELSMFFFAAKAKSLKTGQVYSGVRFGNVLGSTGSVVPLFKEQIAAGGPVTVTHPEMKRYFMSIREAAELIVQAAALAKGGEIFLLDMGEPIAIGELATKMIQLSGQTVKSEAHPNGDIEVITIGPRPGEKLSEELFYNVKSATNTLHPKVLCDPLRPEVDAFPSEIEKLVGVLSRGNVVAVRELLFDISNRYTASPLTSTEA